MTLLSFLECVVVASSWIKKGRESVESLDRNVTSVVVWKMRKNCHSVLIKLQAGTGHLTWEHILCIQYRCTAEVRDLQVTKTCKP